MIKMRFSRRLTFSTFAAAVALMPPAKADTRPLSPVGSRLVGENKSYVVENDDDSLEAIAKKYNVGFLALLRVNSGVDPHIPRVGSVLTIPLQTLLLGTPREGIMINIAELRLYYYPSGKSSMTVYPIDTGQLGGDTLVPTMVTTVLDKHADPTWMPMVDIRAHHKAQGIELPTVVSTRPGNPTGHHAIRLVAYDSVYLLHDTSADFDTGMRVSSGCTHPWDGDIKTLFSQATSGIKMNIVNTPIRISAESNGACLVEIYQPLSEKINDNSQLLPITLNSAMQSFKDAAQTDAGVIQHVVDVRSGMPVDVRRY